MSAWLCFSKIDTSAPASSRARAAVRPPMPPCVGEWGSMQAGELQSALWQWRRRRRCGCRQRRGSQPSLTSDDDHARPDGWASRRLVGRRLASCDRSGRSHREGSPLVQPCGRLACSTDGRCAWRQGAKLIAQRPAGGAVRASCRSRPPGGWRERPCSGHRHPLLPQPLPCRHIIPCSHKNPSVGTLLLGSFTCDVFDLRGLACSACTKGARLEVLSPLSSYRHLQLPCRPHPLLHGSSLS